MKGIVDAFINHGRWVGACPNSACNNAEELHPWPAYQCGHRSCRIDSYPETIFHCSLCHTVDTICWPDRAVDIWEALLERPCEENRNWYPQGHELAVAWNVTHGQTVDELRAEHCAMTG